MTRRRIALVLAVAFATPAYPTDKAVTQLVTNPSPRNIRLASEKGAAILRDLQSEWTNHSAKEQRFIREAIVRTAAAMPASVERTQFLATIESSPDAGDAEILVAKYAGLLLDPNDEKLQDGMLSERFFNFGFSHFGERGFETLSAIYTRAKELDESVEYILARMLATDFPQDGPFVVRENLRKYLVDPITENDEARLTRLATQAENFSDSKIKDEMVALALKDPKAVEFGKLGDLVDDFLQILFANFKEPSQATLDAVWKFYFNSETSNKDKTETDQHFGDRRRRLLGFMTLARHTQRAPETSALVGVSNLVSKNLVEIYSSDMAEFRVGMEQYIVENAAAISLVSKLIATKDEKLMIIGLDIIPRLDLRLLDPTRRDVVILKNWLQGATAIGFPQQTDAIRVRAIAARNHLEGAAERLGVLEGLNSPTIQVRLDTIEILRREKIPSKDLFAPFISVLGRDPEPAVRIAVMKFIQERIDAQDRGFSEGDRLFKSLIFNSKQKNAEVAKVAVETCESFLRDGATPEIIELGLRDGSQPIVDLCQKEIDGLLREKTSEFSRLLDHFGSIPGPSTSGRKQAADVARKPLVDAFNYLNEGPDYKPPPLP